MFNTLKNKLTIFLTFLVLFCTFSTAALMLSMTGEVSADECIVDFDIIVAITILIVLTIILAIIVVDWFCQKIWLDVQTIKLWLERLQYDLTVPFPQVSTDFGGVAQAMEELSVALKTHQETSRSLASALYLDEAVQHALDMVEKVFGAEHGALFLYDTVTQEHKVHGAYGLSDEYIEAARVKLGESISGMVLLTGKPISSSELRQDHPKALPQLVRCEGMSAMLCVPLLSKGRVLGLINVYSKENHNYTANEIYQLSTLANEIALSIENAILFEEMETKATTDRLTGLYNHKHLHEVLSSDLRQTELYNQPLSIILLDIDYFKTYNDSYGHQAGDDLLRGLARILKESVRPNDVVARYGGEEFAVILQGMTFSRAKEIAERIRRSVEQFCFSGREHQPEGAITVSVGIAQYPIHAQTTEELIKKADEALYKAKFMGRNKVEVYSSVLDDLLRQSTPTEKSNLEEIKTMISVISAKDKYTFGHSERVMQYAQALANKLELNEEDTKEISYAAYLHDVGKIEVPWELLLKEAALNDEEWEVICQHPVWSMKILESVPCLKPIYNLVLYHHEWYNGQGYPAGLSGAAIPLGARIITLADSFDAMTTNRLFRAALSIEEAIAELKNQAGRQFDPHLVNEFAQIIESQTKTTFI